MTLAELKRKGDRARILEIDGDDGIATRLMEMGMTEGEEVSLLGFAIWGDPMHLSVRGYRISLRKTEAARVKIAPTETVT